MGDPVADRGELAAASAAPASTLLAAPMNARVSFVIDSTPTPALTPTKPAAMSPATEITSVPSAALTSTFPAEVSFEPSPVYAQVVAFSTVTPAEAATPTSPPATPTTTEITDCWPVAAIEIRPWACAIADLPMSALVVRLETPTPTLGATPTSAPIASEAATLNWR